MFFLTVLEHTLPIMRKLTQLIIIFSLISSMAVMEDIIY
nr:MAG TPA: hypothetical protein [Caudoviricetes sp.]